MNALSGAGIGVDEADTPEIEMHRAGDVTGRVSLRRTQVEDQRALGAGALEHAASSRGASEAGRSRILSCAAYRPTVPSRSRLAGHHDVPHPRAATIDTGDLCRAK